VKSHSAASNAIAHEQEAIKTETWRERLTPLEDRLAKLLSNIPPEVKSQGLSHPGELGIALRKLGYERRRNWTDGTKSFSALWFK
jgi:hypothetical protein